LGPTTPLVEPEPEPEPAVVVAVLAGEAVAIAPTPPEAKLPPVTVGSPLLPIFNAADMKLVKVLLPEVGGLIAPTIPSPQCVS